MYNRQKAVDYANRWWNNFNPAFPKFDDDCTNFISQCLLAGGAPMTGYPDRIKGWWLKGGTWSYSWTTANALFWHLQNSKKGLQGKRVSSESELELGDLIFLDFTGDGRIDHSLIVTSIINGVPYVNAHTTNSYHRLWTYEDSSAYTPNIKYYFIHIEVTP
ncbi:MAG TPA: amidase domain-containing protein [Rummeliibacillus sp.]|nr:amidase domain-containing protein [Rummeliibacillus sp.]